MLNAEHQKNSIRHLAVSDSGVVAFAMQWQGDVAKDLPMLGTYSKSTDTVALAKDASIRTMNGYLGSVAISDDATKVAATSPRSGILQVFGERELMSETRLEDVCGVASTPTGFIVTSGTGLIRDPFGRASIHNLAWDNHLVRI